MTKKTNLLLPELTDENLPEFISKENKHLFPKDMQFAFNYIQSNPIVFPERYFRAQKRLLQRKINKLFKEDKSLTPKRVLLDLAASLPDFIPADMLADLCAFILNSWRQKVEKSKA